MPPCTISGSEGPLCPKSTGNEYSIEAGPDGTTYDWSINGNGTITQNNGNSVVVTAGDGCDSSFTLHVKVTYPSGCHSECGKTVTVYDHIPPTITCPAAVTVQCDENVPEPDIAAVTVSDNCQAPVTVTWVSDVPVGSCPKVITRTYKAVDGCLNESTCTQTITVDDTIPPTITCPAAVTVQCDENVPEPDIAAVTVSDNCQAPVTVTWVSDVPVGSCPKVITRTYKAVDGCLNESTCTQTITVDDTIPPTITCPAAVTVQCDENVPEPDIAAVTVSDNCQAPVTVTWVSDVPVGSCPKVITRTYKAVDGCLNESTCTQTITVDDTIPPTITCPAAVTVQCDENVPEPDIAAVTVSDNCQAPVTVTWVSDVPVGSCPKVITRTYKAVDGCLNESTCTQTITVDDTIPPTITCPAAVTVQCDENVPEPDIAAVTVSDNCQAPVTVTWVSDVPVGSCPKVITRTYKAVDGCLNESTCTQTITVDDTIPPTITCPAAVTVQCDENVPEPDIAAVTVSDNCQAPVTVTWVSDVPVGSCPKVITRTYKAVDGCLNESTCTQTITVDDTIPPTITCPAAVTVQCDENVPEPDIAAVTVSDNCQAPVTVTWVSDVPVGSCPKVITRTYKAVDGCLNESTCTQTITVDDTIPPTITCPAAVTVQCDENVPEPDIAAVTVSDNCQAPVTVTWVSDVPVGSCPKVITRTYKAVDGCLNESTCTQTITVDDTIPPTITCPAAVTVQCDENVPEPDIAAVTVSDNCQAPVTVTWVSDVPVGSCPKVITRTYKAVDGCLNESTCTQTITVDDTIPPTITCPAAVTVQCDENVPEPDIAAVTVSDNCQAPVTVTWVSDVPVGSCPKVITRTYKAVDGCLNESTCTQTITVDDTIPPTIECPPNKSIECNEAIVFDSPTATDNCTVDIQLTESEITETVAADGSTIFTKTYTATDACGNSASCTQTITMAPCLCARVTGGSNKQMNTYQGPNFPTPSPNFVSHGGQVGAPVSVLEPWKDGNECIWGEWQHNRHQGRKNLVGSFHAAGNAQKHQFDKILSVCLPCDENVGALGTVGLCNPGDRICGPEPRKAPANRIAFSGVGDYTYTTGKKTLKAIFRVDIEDRGEGNSHASTQPNDRYRMRLWILDPSLGRSADPTDPANIALRKAVAPSYLKLVEKDPLVAEALAVTPDIDDGGDMTQGNHQIHPAKCDRCVSGNTAASTGLLEVTAEVAGHTPTGPCTFGKIAGGYEGLQSPAFVHKTTIANHGTEPLVNLVVYELVNDTYKEVTSDYLPAGQILQPGESVTKYRTETLIEDQVRTIMVSGQSSLNGKELFAASTGVATVGNAEVACKVTLASPVDVDGAPNDGHLLLPPGQTCDVILNVEVTNTGDADLAGVTVSDTWLKSANAPFDLAKGATKTVICTGRIASPGQAITPQVSVTGKVMPVCTQCAYTETGVNIGVTTAGAGQVESCTLPKLSINANRTVELGDNWTFDTPAVVGGCNVAVSVLGADVTTRSTVNPVLVTKRTWKGIDPWGNSTTCSQTVTVLDTTPPSMIGNPPGVVLCSGNYYIPSLPSAADNSGGAIAWTYTRSDMAGKAFTDLSVFAAPPAAGTTTFAASARDACGNVSTASWTVTITPCEEHCTMTQADLGSDNGMAQTQTQVDLVTELIGAQPVVLGTGGTTLAIPADQAAHIVRRLPATGPAAALTAGHYVFGENSGADLPLDKKGKLRNGLLGQTVALTLALRYDTTLAGFSIANSFTTWRIGSRDPLNVGKGCQSYTIPASVLSTLQSLGLQKNVQGLLTLANRGLAGQATGTATLTDIANAVTMVNEAFGGCRVSALGGCVN